MTELVSHNEPETLAVGRALGALLAPGDVVAIDGPLGAGKTRLVRGIALGLGLPGSVVSSPTYVMVNEYTLPDGPEPVPTNEPRPRRMFHVDAYRLSGPDDLDSLGWDRVVNPAAEAVVAIEWAERIAGPASEGGTAVLLDRSGHSLREDGAEPALCKVRMEPVAPEPGETIPAADTDEHSAPQPGIRLISVEIPAAWAAQARAEGARGEAWRDWRRLTRVLATGDQAPPAASTALPRGWARCPTTGRPVPPDAPTFPFADSRARMADLGRWMTGAYTISREVRPEDEADNDFGRHTA